MTTYETELEREIERLRAEVAAWRARAAGLPLRTVVRRVMPTDRFPDFARKMTGERLTLVETTTWAASPSADGSRTAEVSMHVEGAPVTSSTSTVVRPSGDGATEEVTGQVTAKVPLVGGRIEKAVLPALDAALEAQVDAYREWTGSRG